VCNSNTEEQKYWKCVILIQRSITVSVLFLYRGAASLVVCYTNIEEQQHQKCVILI